jgi:N-acetylneuraminic acid mutarotase
MLFNSKLFTFVTTLVFMTATLPTAPFAPSPLNSGPRLGWTTLPSLPKARARPATTVGRDGKIYVFGGFTGANGAYQVTNSVFIYDPRGRTWSQGVTMPIAMEGGTAVTLPNGRIVVMGGGVGCFFTQACAILQTVQEYDPRSHVWCLLAPMRTPRYRFAATLGLDNRIYAIGGWNGRSVLASVEAYSLRTNNWRSVASLPQAEESAAATVTHNRVVVAGGTGSNTSFYNDLFVFDGHRWRNGSPMRTPRADFGLVVNATGQLYAFGGYNPADNFLAKAETYNPATDTWAAMAALPRPMASFGAVTGPDGRAYAIGGYDGNMANTQVVAYGPVTPRKNPFAG